MSQCVQCWEKCKGIGSQEEAPIWRRQLTWSVPERAGMGVLGMTGRESGLVACVSETSAEKYSEYFRNGGFRGQSIKGGLRGEDPVSGWEGEID